VALLEWPCRFQILLELDFDTAFFISSVIWNFILHLLISKKVLAHTDILSFMTLSLLASTTYLGVVCLVLQQPFSGFSSMGWFIYSSGSLPIDGLVIGKFCNPTHACYKSFIKFAQSSCYNFYPRLVIFG
jgi:hypothetical protein